MFAVAAYSASDGTCEPEDVDLVLGIGRERDVPDQVGEPDEEEEGPDQREPPLRHPRVHVALGDVGLHQLVERLDGSLHPVRPRLHAVRDVHPRRDRERRSHEQVEHRLVDAHVERADLERDPVVELELVLGLELLVLAVVAEQHVEQDADQQVEPDADEDLAAAAQSTTAGLRGGRGGHRAASSGRRIMRTTK